MASETFQGVSMALYHGPDLKVQGLAAQQDRPGSPVGIEGLLVDLQDQRPTTFWQLLYLQIGISLCALLRANMHIKIWSELWLVFSVCTDNKQSNWIQTGKLLDTKPEYGTYCYGIS